MKKVEIRSQRLSDAKRFYEILNNDNFKLFDVRPSSVEAEKEYLKLNKKKAKENFEYNFTILFNGNVAGAIGVKIDQHRKHVGEIGYFVDEKYWGKGLAVKAVKWLEKYCFKELGLKRITLVLSIKNKASERVAIKAGYKKEGIMKKCLGVFGKYHDSYLYAKVIK